MVKLKDPIIAAGLSAAVFALWMIKAKIAPFGEATFAVADAAIQYLDFFAWEKQILSGDASPFFSFNKGVGGLSFAVFSYYLMSPFNLLLAIFPYEKIIVFYHLASLLKLSFGAFAAALYLNARFNLKSEWKIILAVGFSLSTWPIQQLYNLMWLDVIYLLPLVMLFIYRYEMGKSFIPVILAMAASIIINWYQGFIMLMFVFIFSVIDHIWFLNEKTDKREIFKFALKIMGFIIAAVILSLPMLIPTFSALALGRGGVDWDSFGFRVFASPYKLLTGIIPGYVSDKGDLHYYGGEIMMLSMLAFFFKIRGRKLIGGVVIATVIYLMYYFEPFYFLFSLLKNVGGYYYRYGLLATFAAMFLAAHFLNTVTITANKRKILSALTLPIICVHISFIMKPAVFPEGAKVYGNYVNSEKATIAELKAKDTSVYRINQTAALPLYNDSRFVMQPRANYNEGLAYDYMTLETYTSSPVNNQMELLDALGYRRNGDNFNIYAMPLLPSDSLMGVKYVRSNIDIKGLSVLSDIKETNGKKTYLNPFAMPLVFRTDKLLTEFYKTENPMENVNRIYNELFGVSVYREVFPQNREIPAEEKLKISDIGGAYNNNIKFKEYIGYALPNTDNAIYGVIPTREEIKGVIHINDKLYYRTHDWLGLSAFYAPTENGAKIAIASERKPNEAKFYEADEAALQRANDIANMNAAKITKRANTSITFRVNGKGGDYAFTSFPYVKGAKVTRNGENVDMICHLFCLAGVPLVEGENVIEIRY